MMELLPGAHTQPLSVLLTIFIGATIFGACFANPTTHADTDQQLSELATKVEAIDEKLDALSDSINTKLDILIDQDTQSGANPPQGGQASTPSPGPVDPLNTLSVQVLSVERLVIPSGNQFKVRFTKTIDLEDVVTELYASDKKRGADTVEEEGNGVCVATFTSTVDRHSFYPWIFLGEKGDYMVGMEVRTDQSNPAFQDSLQIPVLTIQPANKIAYEPGEDVVIETSIAREGGESDDSPPLDVDSYFSGVNLETGEYQLSFEDLVNASRREELPGTTRQSFTVLTSTHRVSGYLQLTAYNYEGIREESLVKQIQVMRHIEIYPSNQTGYLPPGYLTLVDIYGPDMKKSANGNPLFRCLVGTECKPECYGVGEQISELQVFEVLPGGEAEPVDNQHAGPNRDNFLTTSWTVEPSEDFGDSEGITTYECRATDLTNSNMVSRRVDVQAALAASIDHERSSFEIEDDQTDPEKKRVTLHCAVRGRPLPEVVFTADSTGSPFPMSGDPPDYVTPTGENEAIATKVIRIDASELTSVESDTWSIPYLGSGPQCGFYSWDDFIAKTHTFDLQSSNSADAHHFNTTF